MNTRPLNNPSDEFGTGGDAAAGGEAALPPAPAGGAAPEFLQEAPPVTRLLLITGPKEWRYLLSGIDSLDLGFYVTWGDDWLKLLQSLREGKRLAENTDGQLWRYKDGPDLLILPKGRRMYAFGIRHPAGIVYISDKPEGKGYPNVYVSLLAEKIWQLGHRVAADMIRHCIERLGGRVQRVQVSRLDVAADMHIPEGMSIDFLRSHLVSRSRKSSQHLEGDVLETFYSGGFKAPIRLRIYDKSREILHSQKLWFCDLWKIEGKPENVWRIEFQLRRDAVKQFRIDQLDDLQERIGGLWAHLTERWFSLRLHDNSNRTRCTEHPWWLAVQSIAAKLGSEIAIERRRDPDKIADASWYVNHAAGCMAAFAARMKISDPAKAAAAFKAEIESYWQSKDFQERYRVNRKKLDFDDDERGAA